MDPDGRARILVVDDEPDIVQGLSTFLQSKLGAIIVTAANAAEGLKRLGESPVDLVISDYKMPGMNGLDFLAKAQELRPDSVRVMMTAYADLDLAIKAINEARILHFFTKPIDPDHLVLVLEAVLRAQVAMRKRDEALRRSLELMSKPQRNHPGKT
jgi:adenylate cyclase